MEEENYYIKDDLGKRLINKQCNFSSHPYLEVEWKLFDTFFLSTSWNTLLHVRCMKIKKATRTHTPPITLQNIHTFSTQGESGPLAIIK